MKDARADDVPMGGLLYVMTAFAALGGFLFGYDTGVIAGALLFVTQDFGLSTAMQQIVTSAVLAGALVGAAGAGVLADHLGRRVILVIAGILYVAGALGSGVAASAAMLGASRLVVGFAIGLTSTVAPLYMAEVAPAAHRGALVATYQLAITIGILVATLVDEALSASRSWGWMFGLAALPGGLQLVGMTVMPESPRWLVAKRRVAEARDVLRRIGVAAPDVEVRRIGAVVAAEAAGTWGDLLAPAVWPALVVGVAMAVFQQITGINTVFYYAPTIFEDAGFRDPATAIWASVALSAVNVAATFIAVRWLDRVGRRALLAVGLIGMAVSLGLLGVAFRDVGAATTVGAPEIAAVGFLGAYVICFAFSLGPVVWVLIAEIFPLRVRGLAVSVATMANWGANMVVGLTFLSLIDTVGRSATFWLFGVLCILALVFVLRRVPETRGKTLEEIETFWRAG